MKRSFAVILVVLFCVGSSLSQNVSETEKNISQAVESRNYDIALTELQKFRMSDDAAFIAKDYDYLLARTAELKGDLAIAIATYRAVADRNSVLKPYALKHLAQIARSTGNLLLERIYLNEIRMFSPDSLAAKGAVYRLARNGFESGNYTESIATVGGIASTDQTSGKPAIDREIKALLAEAYFRSGQIQPAKDTFIALLDSVPNAAQPDDIALLAVKDLDVIDGGEKGKRLPRYPKPSIFAGRWSTNSTVSLLMRGFTSKR